MIDLKLPKKTKKEMEKEATIGYPYDGDTYPYGCKLRFEKEQIEKIGALKSMNAGDKVRLIAVGTITSVDIHDKADDKKSRRSVEIQIEKIDIPDPNSEDAGFKQFTDKT